MAQNDNNAVQGGNNSNVVGFSSGTNQNDSSRGILPRTLGDKHRQPNIHGDQSSSQSRRRSKLLRHHCRNNTEQ